MELWWIGWIDLNCSEFVLLVGTGTVGSGEIMDTWMGEWVEKMRWTKKRQCCEKMFKRWFERMSGWTTGVYFSHSQTHTLSRYTVTYLLLLLCCRCVVHCWKQIVSRLKIGNKVYWRRPYCYWTMGIYHSNYLSAVNACHQEANHWIPESFPGDWHTFERKKCTVLFS